VRTNDGADLTLDADKVARIFELGPIAFVAPRSFSDANDAIAAAAVASLRASDRLSRGRRSKMRAAALRRCSARSESGLTIKR